MIGTKKSRTTPYHPMGKGQCERFNRTLLSMLGTLEPGKKADWKSQVAPLVLAYNACAHATTKKSPFFLLFGCNPRLPIDPAVDLLDLQSKRTRQQYVDKLQERLKNAYKVAAEEAGKQTTDQKRGSCLGEVTCI